MATTTTTIDRSEFRHVLLSGTWTGVVTALAVIVFLVISRVVPSGIVQALLETVIVLVAGIGCLRGLQTAAGASAVGDSATRAVVSGIILLVVVDGLFALAYYILNI